MLERVPLEEDAKRVRLSDGQPHGHLCAVSPGRARPAGDRSRRLPPFSQRQMRSVRKKCQAGAIRFDDEDQLVTEEVGAIVVATGFQLYSIGKEQADGRTTGYGEYGYGESPDVIDSLQFERLVSASGPTGGEIRRPSDGKVPKTVVFVSCVGSRDNAKGISYCSKICCMYTAKHTMLYKHKVHDGQAHVFYMDIRAGGKNYDEFVRRAIEQDGAQYHRGRVSKITAGKRPSDRSRRRYVGRRTADDRSRSGRVGRGHAARRPRRGIGPKAQRRLRRERFSLANRIRSCGRSKPTRPACSCAAPAKARKTFPSRWLKPARWPAKC